MLLGKTGVACYIGAVMLELRHVCKRFRGIPAVDQVSFSLRAGQIIGYLGPNGSGKSTTLKMIAGLLETTSGAVPFNGEPIDRDLIAYKQRIDYIPEEPHLYSHLSGLEYPVMVAQLRNLPPKQTVDCIEEPLRLLSLHSSRHTAIAADSKGMRQKVPVSAALLHNPDLYCSMNLSLGWMRARRWCCAVSFES
jgi:ABC-2 type transport system ATP-binding protein